MLVYISVFVIALLYYFIGKGNLSKSNNMLMLIFGFFALLIGLGDMIGGYDRYIYGEMFDSIADETLGSKDYLRHLVVVNGYEYGYFGWQIVCSYITANRYIYILITTLIMYCLYYRTMRDYISDYPLAIVLFLGLFYYFTMTYLRQTLACGIAWQGIKYIWERKPIKFFLIVLIAFSFHNSAIFFAIMYLIPRKKFPRYSILWVLFISLILGFTPLPLQIMSSSGGDRTINYQDSMNGFRIEYIFEAIFFISIFFMNYRLIPNNKKDITFLNMGIVFCSLLLLFLRFGQGGRIGWFFLMGIIYTLTTLCTNKYAKKWMRPFFITVSFVLFMRITTSWSFNLLPYKTFLTQGYPCGEKWLYENFEYDQSYTYNKLYRPIFTFWGSKQ